VSFNGLEDPGKRGAWRLICLTNSPTSLEGNRDSYSWIGNKGISLRESV
jgi:hypothetical protein